MKDKELTPIQELVLGVVKIAQDLGLRGLTREQILQSVETLQPFIAQERRKAKIEVLERLTAIDCFNENYTSDPRPAIFVRHFLAELKEDKEA